MKTPTNETKFKFGEKEILFREYFDDDFSSIVTTPTQCLGVILNEKNEILLVSPDNEWWGLPGGKPEKGETPEQTLEREVYEETAVAINTSYIIPFFYVIGYEILGDELKYESTQLRFISKVKRIDEFVQDPGGNQKFRRFIPIDKIDSELSWKGTRNIIKVELKKKLVL